MLLLIECLVLLFNQMCAILTLQNLLLACVRNDSTGTTTSTTTTGTDTIPTTIIGMDTTRGEGCYCRSLVTIHIMFRYIGSLGLDVGYRKRNSF